MTRTPSQANRALVVLALLVVAALTFFAWKTTRSSNADSATTSEPISLASAGAAGVVLEADTSLTEEPIMKEARSVAVESATNVVTKEVKRLGSIVGVVRSNDERVRRLNSGSVTLEQDVWDKPREGMQRQFDGFQVKHSTPIAVNGSFAFEHIPLGPWILRIESVGFESLTQRLRLLESPEPLDVEFGLVPLVTSKLEVILNGPNGSPLLDNLTGLDRDSAEALQPVFLEACPQVGADLTSAARRLIQKSRDVRREHPDLWMIAEFKEPTAGCVCVVLGARVLDAVPFAQGQAVVVLRVDPADFGPARCALELIVRDSITTLPISMCAASLTQQSGNSRTIGTSAGGSVRFESLLAGSVRVTMTRQGYASRSVEFVLAAGDRTRRETIDLEPILSLSGRVRFPAGGPFRCFIAATPIESRPHSSTRSPGRQIESKPEFVIPDLAPGEYLVGVTAPFVPVPSIEDVRAGKVVGWKVIDLRHGEVHGIEIEITSELAVLLQRSDWKFR